MKNKTMHYLLNLMAFLLITYTVYPQVWVIREGDNNATYIDKSWVKVIEHDDEGVNTTIYNVSEDIMILIDDNQGIYAKGSSVDFCNAFESLRNDMNKNAPESRQKMMQDMIKAEKAKPAPEITVSKSDGEKIIGYQTTKYSIFMNGGLYEEMWITNDAALKSVIDANRKILEKGFKIAKCFVPDEVFLKSSIEFSKEYKELEMNGVTLKSINYDDYNSNNITDVVSVAQENVSAVEFEVPDGYRMVSFKDMLMSKSGM